GSWLGGLRGGGTRVVLIAQRRRGDCENESRRCRVPDVQEPLLRAARGGGRHTTPRARPYDIRAFARRPSRCRGGMIFDAGRLRRVRLGGGAAPLPAGVASQPCASGRALAQAKIAYMMASGSRRPHAPVAT